jgi:hypothetical protein
MGPDAHGQGVRFGVRAFVFVLEASAQVRVDGKEAEVDREAGAELVGDFLDKLFDVVDEVAEVAVKAAAVAL